MAIFELEIIGLGSIYGGDDSKQHGATLVEIPEIYATQDDFFFGTASFERIDCVGNFGHVLDLGQFICLVSCILYLVFFLEHVIRAIPLDTCIFSGIKSMGYSAVYSTGIAPILILYSWHKSKNLSL